MRISATACKASRPETHCPHNEECRADLERPQEMLCGYHSHKRWDRCFLFVLYEHAAKKAKDEQSKGENDASNGV